MIFRIVLLILTFLLVTPPSLFAYIDPGTGFSVASGFLGWIVGFLGIMGGAIVIFFKRIRVLIGMVFARFFKSDNKKT